MIQIKLNDTSARKLQRELRSAGDTEIGGVLAAEQVADGSFVVLELSVQRDGGLAHFDREPEQHRKFIRSFHRRHGNKSERFNYLGEWHSHPGFIALPSLPDVLQMQRLVEDPEQTASFLVLLVLKLAVRTNIVGSAHAFRRGHPPLRAGLSGVNVPIMEERPSLSVLTACCANQAFL